MADKVKTTEKLVDLDHPKVRVSGEAGSPQNTLRGSLYTEALSRIKSGLKDNRYFEVVSLCDTIITDRFEALSQTLIHPEYYLSRLCITGRSHCDQKGWTDKSH